MNKIKINKINLLKFNKYTVHFTRLSIPKVIVGKENLVPSSCISQTRAGLLEPYTAVGAFENTAIYFFQNSSCFHWAMESLQLAGVTPLTLRSLPSDGSEWLSPDLPFTLTSGDALIFLSSSSLIVPYGSCLATIKQPRIGCKKVPIASLFTWQVNLGSLCSAYKSLLVLKSNLVLPGVSSEENVSDTEFLLLISKVLRRRKSW